MREEAFLFGTAPAMTGVVTRPDSTTQGLPGVVLMNAGVTHRVGPNRLYVLLARRLAAAGFPAFRFDFSGIGDSEVRKDRLPPEQSVFLETREALDALSRHTGVQEFLLMGICSGATVAYLTTQEDPRVVGAIMINAIGHLHGRNPALAAYYRGRATARHSWRIALFSSFRRKNWLKAVKGQLNPFNIFRMMVVAPLSSVFSRKQQDAPVSTAPVPSHDALAEMESLSQRGVHLFHLYCEGDEGLDYYHVVMGKRAAAAGKLPNHSFEVIRGANHVFTMLWSQDRLVQAISDWIEQFAEKRRRSSS